MVDFGRTAADYGVHRQGFPDSLWPRLRALGIGMPGQRVLDVGTGTGKIAQALQARGCRVEGIDKDPAMIAEARRTSPDIAFRVAPAEETGAADASFDVVIAGQCWHWFDRVSAAREASRVLAAGGALVMAHFDFLRGYRIVDETWKVIEPLRTVRGNVVPLPPQSVLGERTLYAEWLADLRDAGFVRSETFSYPVDAHYTRSSWRGRMRASVWVGATLDPAHTRRIDAKLEAMLDNEDEPLVVPHRVCVISGRKPSTGAEKL
jgi:SAM-dependent methyltransferase